MKANIKDSGPNCFIIKLTPEDIEDEAKIRVLGKNLDRSHIINCRGFEYKEPDVEFYIRPYVSRD